MSIVLLDSLLQIRSRWRSFGFRFHGCSEDSWGLNHCPVSGSRSALNLISTVWFAIKDIPPSPSWSMIGRILGRASVQRGANGYPIPRGVTGVDPIAGVWPKLHFRKLRFLRFRYSLTACSFLLCCRVDPDARPIFWLML